MSQPRRLNTPLYSPVPSLAAANQSQIEDLVQRNKTLDVMHKKLLDEVKQERERHKEEIQRIKEDHVRLEEDWRKNSYDLLGICRIHHKKVELTLEEERSKVIQEMRISREEKLGRMQTDYKLKLFQMSHEEAEQQIADLEDQIHDIELDHQDEIQRLRDAHEEVVIRLKETQSELKQLRKTKDNLQDKYHRLSEDLANQRASSSTSSTKLERLKLQLEGANTKNSDLETKIEELKRANADLQRRMDEWQSLEKREGEEADSERKRRVALSVELEKKEADVENLTAILEKERQKVAKWKDAVDQWKNSSQSADAELKTSQKLVAKLQKQVDKLKDELAAERSRIGPNSAPPPRSPVHVDVDQVEETPKPRKQRAAASTKPASQQNGRQARSPEPSEVEDEPGPSKPTTTRKAAPKKKAAEHVDLTGPDDDVEEIPAIEEVPSDSDAGDKKGKAPAKPKRKRKEVAAEETESDAPQEVPKKKAKPPSKTKPAPVATLAIEEDEESQIPAVQKKRKINQNKSTFPKNTDPFNFGSLDFGAGGGLDIPSTLSPVRPDAVPPRSDNFNSRRSGLR